MEPHSSQQAGIIGEGWDLSENSVKSSITQPEVLAEWESWPHKHLFLGFRHLLGFCCITSTTLPGDVKISSVNLTKCNHNQDGRNTLTLTLPDLAPISSSKRAKSVFILLNPAAPKTSMGSYWWAVWIYWVENKWCFQKLLTKYLERDRTTENTTSNHKIADFQTSGFILKLLDYLDLKGG